MEPTTSTAKSLLQGELIVDQITIINPEGQAIQINDIVSNLRLFESIDKYFVSGRVTVVDSIDILKYFKVVGQESLTIQIRARDDSEQGDGHYSTKENQIDKSYRVYAISDETPTENQNVKSNGFCYIGSDNNIRHCIEVYDGEICESGDVYNRIDKCLAPQRFS